MNRIEEYIKDVTSEGNSALVSIDKKDMDPFVKGNDIVDAEKIVGTIETIFSSLAETLNRIIERNKSGKCNAIILDIRQSEGTEMTMDNIADIIDILSKSGKDVDIIWGLSTKKSLEPKTIELILFVGFKANEE
ncbi:MAG: hypothetical protein IKY79_09300 [Bacteroidales bacterium]|nr:hypothetical protein [Bacteroidales bacterium]